MKCPNPKCGREIQEGYKYCPFCSTSIEANEKGAKSSGIKDSVFKAGSVHVGDHHFHEAPDPSKRKSATETGIHCPICHQIVKGADHFACPKCGRTHIHLKHQDPDTYLCSECVAQLKSAQGDIQIGDSFGNGRYYVKKLLGLGGMGKVFLVLDKEWDKDFAFKFLPRELSKDKKAISSLRKEADLMSQLNHDYLARLFDMGSDGNRHYLKMEYIDGQSLEETLENNPSGHLSVEETLDYVKQIVQGLQYLHSRNVVHRDLKPGNIMQNSSGRLKILDFGIAQTIKDTMTRVTNMPSTGTLVYMSPEQLMGERLSPQSDIYSLGIIIYELLNGKPPFHTGPIFEQHLNVSPKPIEGINSSINECLLKALSKKSSDRYKSCTEFTEELEKAVMERQILSATQPSPTPDVKSHTSTVSEKPKPARFESLKTKTSQADEAGDKADKKQKNKLTRKHLIYGVLTVAALIVILVSITSYLNWNESRTEENTFLKAKETNNPELYLKKYPHGSFRQEMLSMRDSLILIKLDEEAFERAQGAKPVEDIDGNVYRTVKIGNQVWMAENLKVTHYRNGDSIAHVTDKDKWEGLKTGAYCNYDNSEGHVAVYGRLYNWYAVDDSRNIAPEGWHVPTDAEWKQLEMYLGMSQDEANATDLRGTDEGGKLKESGTRHWQSPNKGATNESGFSALPGGLRLSSGTFYSMGSYAYFWSSTESYSYDAWSRTLGCYSSQVYRYGSYKQNGFSVRCVRD